MGILATSRAALCPQPVLLHLQIRIPFCTKQEAGSPFEAPPTPSLSPPSFPYGQTPSSPHVTPDRHPCPSSTSQQRGVGGMVVVIVGGCCEVPTGSRAPPRLELTLLTHHAPCHNLTQRNATRRTTTPHSTMQRHPPRRSTTHPNMGPHNLTQPTAPQPNASPHKSPQSPSSSSCSPHLYPIQRDWQPCAPPGWEGFSWCCLRMGSLENPGHSLSTGALAGALCGYGGGMTLAVPGTETCLASCRQDPALSAKELAEGTAMG